MTALWKIHGRAMIIACLLLVSALVPAVALATPPPGSEAARIAARDDHRRMALAPARKALAVKRAERARAMAAVSAPAPAPKPKPKAAAKPKAGAKGQAPPVGDYGDSQAIDLPTDVQAGPARTSGGSSGSLGRTLFGLFVVVGLIYGLTALLRRMRSGTLTGGATKAGGLKAVSSIPLGPNRSIHLVRAGQEYLLVGAAEHGVVPLRTYTEDEARTAGLLDGSVPVVASASDVAAAPPRRPWDGLRLSTVVDDLRARTVRR